MDHPTLHNGRDKRVPPKGKSEGHACHARLEGHVYRARRSEMDCQTAVRGPDKQVPPRGNSEGHVYRAR